jgi:hypothetical protein
LSSPHESKSRRAKIDGIIEAAKRLGKEYYTLTGRPLGVTGEIAEHEAFRLLRLEQAPPREPGYDAVRRTKSGRRIRLQIKSRCYDQEQGQRMPPINLKKPWDRVLLVILNRKLNPVEVLEARRAAIERRIKKPGSRARNRGALAVSQFRSIARQLWRAKATH